VEELAERRGAEAFACVREGAVVGLGGVAGVVEVPPDGGEGAVTEEGLGDDEPDDAVGGEVALASGMAAAFPEGIEDEGDGEELVEGEDAIEDLLGLGVRWGGVDGERGSSDSEGVGSLEFAVQQSEGVGLARGGAQDHGQGLRGWVCWFRHPHLTEGALIVYLYASPLARNHPTFIHGS
jgi:hypothetical protein